MSILGSVIFLLMVPFVFSQNTNSSSIESIQSRIQNNNQAIQQLQQEIKAYQDQVNQISQEARTLANEVRGLELSERKLLTDIRLTETRIAQARIAIENADKDINSSQTNIITNKDVIAQSLRFLQEYQNRPLIELLVSTKSISEFFAEYHDLIKVQNALYENIDTLRENTQQLETSKVSFIAEEKKLQQLQQSLEDQRKIVQQERVALNTLLKETQNEETKFQALLSARLAQQQALDKEIRDYESQLQFALDPQSLPRDGSQVLGWPLDNVFITQMFGATVSARRLYVSGSHSGVDFRSAVGTPLYAVADGIVEGVGDTDSTCPRASWGKWIFIRHPNGLASAYGHLSLIRAQEGQTVRKGDLIGYTGNTGRTTGPHLHLTIFASRGIDGGEGARVDERPSVACPGKNYRMPLAPTNAYLDPLLYLPATNRSMFKSTAF